VQLLDEQDLVAVLEQLTRNGTTHIARPGNHYSHIPFRHSTIFAYSHGTLTALRPD
jgi:hypothetical protein